MRHAQYLLRFLGQIPQLWTTNNFVDDLMGAEDLADFMPCLLSLLLLSLMVMGEPAKEELTTLIFHVADISSKEGCRNHR